jgi:hypothetical protein
MFDKFRQRRDWQGCRYGNRSERVYRCGHRKYVVQWIVGQFLLNERIDSYWCGRREQKDVIIARSSEGCRADKPVGAGDIFYNDGFSPARP